MSPGDGLREHRVEPRRSLPPRVLDPILILAERIDERRRGIRAIRADGVLGLERTRWGGPPVRLRDGTVVRRGDRIGEMHFRSDRARGVAEDGWQSIGFRSGHEDLRALAAWAAVQPSVLRPVAYHGVTIHAAFARREGWEIRPRPRTFRPLLDEWYMRWLMGHWSSGGRERLRHGHGDLRSVEIWLSAAALQALYGDPASEG